MWEDKNVSASHKFGLSNFIYGQRLKKQIEKKNKINKKQTSELYAGRQKCIGEPSL